MSKLQTPPLATTIHKTYKCFYSKNNEHTKNQGSRYNFLLERTMGRPGEERSEPENLEVDLRVLASKNLRRR